MTQWKHAIDEMSKVEDNKMKKRMESDQVERPDVVLVISIPVLFPGISSGDFGAYLDAF